MFKCIKCGKCCRSLNKSKLYDDFHNGDGICKWLNEESNECTIYNSRPLICRIDEGYEAFFKDIITKEEYYNENYKICKSLREE
ncbi:YkgJ family cysteine cluster protein [Haloimpatiens massiliensis]|uniref:YkgJ family cysteine cluster protein n=1 Tax=Haloimpatiens massiliensis TaxID=1658110 RepID=UPI000C85C6B2|nr:YkgJ family cysteine cluster protein [Haloimpatiens massiliensis]